MPPSDPVAYQRAHLTSNLIVSRGRNHLFLVLLIFQCIQLRKRILSG